MFKLRIRCLSKNSGEVFYEYDTKVIHTVDTFLQKFNASIDTFLHHLQFDIKEDCTFEVTVLHVKEELPIFNDLEEHSDFNDPPVVF